MMRWYSTIDRTCQVSLGLGSLTWSSTASRKEGIIAQECRVFAELENGKRKTIYVEHLLGLPVLLDLK